MGKNYLYIIYFLLLSILNHTNAQIKIACIGNSITQGSSTASYPSQLAIHLGSNYDVENYGQGSTTVLQNTDIPYIGCDHYYFSIATPHDVVLILLGTNDSQEKYWEHHEYIKEDYLDLINDYKNYPNHDDPTFILGLPPPIFLEGSQNAHIVETISIIKQIAKETGYIIADFYSVLDGKPELFTDGVHPNYDGAEIMAEVAYNAIINAFKPNTPTGLKTISGLNNITLNWNTSSETDLKYYQIYRSDNPDIYPIYLDQVNYTETNYIDNSVIPNIVHYYRIRAIDLNGVPSNKSGIVSGTTLDLVPPSAPLNLQAILEADSVKISWTPNTEFDIEKYHIYRNTILDDIQQPSSIIGNVHAPDSNFVDINYDSATNYYYGVTAIDISDNEGLISNIVNITTISRPSSSDTTLTFYEDIPHQFHTSDFPLTDADGHTLDKIIFIDSDHLEYFTYDNNAIDSTLTFNDISKLLFTSDLDEFGEEYAEFSFKVVDSFGSTSLDTNMLAINVASVNDAPHIDSTSDLYLMEDSHNLLLPITGINAGPANELQNLSVKAFADLVNINDIQYNSPEETGLVIVDPVNNAFGIIPVTIQIVDDGGTINGGIDTFSTIFNIHISPINDPPIFNILDSINIQEDSETNIKLTGIQAGPWETDQQINMTAQSNNTDILPHPVLNYNSPDTSATLIFSTISNIFGLSSITITISDNGGTDFGGIDSTSYIIPVEITSVNDKPADFNIITPITDSTLVINKSNYLDAFIVRWEASSDIENDDILYNIIFNGDFSALSRYSINSTSTEYILKEILSATDTVSIASGTFSVIATDSDLETNAMNSDIALTIDGRSFAPTKLHLDQNYPNPFNRATIIGFDLPNSTNVSIIIYDLLGEEVIKLINNKKYPRGYNTVTWNGLDKHNNLITAGIYIMQIRTGSNELHKKLIFLK